MPTIIIDTREQNPFVFDFESFGDAGKGWTSATETLLHGDYSIKGLTDLITIERKNISDFVTCCGAERERFVKELIALRGYKYKAVLIEAKLSDIKKGKWHSKITPQSVLGSIASWRVKYGIEFIYAENHEHGAEECFRLLRKFYDYCKDFTKVISL